MILLALLVRHFIHFEMESKEIEISGKTYVVKELKYKQVSSLNEGGAENHTKNMMKLSIDITDEDFDNLSMKDGLKIQQVINELNGFGDFQAPQEK
jgi:hypothetical protein